MTEVCAFTGMPKKPITVEIIASGDVMLAQKIALETDEQGLLKIARNFAPRW
jgi:hypothetical protein